jgi:hypothetical protein
VELEWWLSSLGEEERRAMAELWDKYVSRESRLSVHRFANGMRNEMRALASSFLHKQITLQKWYDESRRLMKLSYLAVIEKKDPQHDTQKTLAVILFLFLLLNKFASDLMGGEIRMNGHIVSRAGMYGDAVYSVSENWTLQSVLGLDMECRRVLGPNENHCYPSDLPGCIELAQMGWVPVANMIPLGQTTCRSNCRCRIEYRKKNPMTLLS